MGSVENGTDLSSYMDASDFEFVNRGTSKTPLKSVPFGSGDSNGGIPETQTLVSRDFVRQSDWIPRSGQDFPERLRWTEHLLFGGCPNL